jgi:hypothetical protein
MDRLHGAAEAVTRIQELLWPVPEASFDAAFSNQRAAESVSRRTGPAGR